MTKQEFNDIINRVLDLGIEIRMTKEDNTVWYNMNTGMKSDLLISYKDNVCSCKGRYDHKAEIDSYDNLLYEIFGCYHGRDFGNFTWQKELEDNNFTIPKQLRF